MIGTVMPTISAAYDLQRPGFYINPEQTWISLRYQNKAVALFKHERLGLPNGRKRNLAIPEAFRSDAHLMRPLARELLATDGLLGFYNSGRHNPHKYPRIQIRLKARLVIEQLAMFLRDDLGIGASSRSILSVHEGRSPSLQQILQINRSEDIDTWRREVGFSNPSHISRMMIFESLGECIPRTSIVGRIAFLSGRSSRLETLGSITPQDLFSVADKMRKSFGFPRIDGEAILQKTEEINKHLRSRLGRGLPVLVDS